MHPKTRLEDVNWAVLWIEKAFKTCGEVAFRNIVLYRTGVEQGSNHVKGLLEFDCRMRLLVLCNRVKPYKHSKVSIFTVSSNIKQLEIIIVSLKS